MDEEDSLAVSQDVSPVYRRLVLDCRALEASCGKITAELREADQALAERQLEHRRVAAAHRELEARLAASSARRDEIQRQTEQLREVAHIAEEQTAGLRTGGRRVVPREESDELRSALRRSLGHGPTFWAVAGRMALLVGSVWAACFCATLDAVTGSMFHWLLFFTAQSAAVAWLVTHAYYECANLEIVKFEHDQLAHGVLLCSPEDSEKKSVEQIASSEGLLRAQRHEMAPGAFLMFQHILYLVLYLLASPNSCACSQMIGVGGDQCLSVVCRDVLVFGALPPAGAAAWLGFTLPIIWALAWHCVGQKVAVSSAKALLDRLEQCKHLEGIASTSPRDPGAELENRLASLVCGLELWWYSLRQATPLLLIDTLDAVDAWQTASAATSWPPGLRRQTAAVAVAALLSMVFWASRSALGSRLQVERLTADSVHVRSLMQRFASGKLQLPPRNREAALRSLQSVVLVDGPLFCVRLLGLHVGLRSSPFVVKNFVCLVCHLGTGARYLHWLYDVRSVRRACVTGAWATEGSSLVFGGEDGGFSQRTVHEHANEGLQVAFAKLFCRNIGGLCGPPSPTAFDLEEGSFHDAMVASAGVRHGESDPGSDMATSASSEDIEEDAESVGESEVSSSVSPPTPDKVCRREVAARGFA